jgi:hypothetical protein
MTPKARIATPLVLFAFAFALPFATGGCGKQACFFWTEAEGACPSQAEAIDFFGNNQGCGSPIESVDSEPEYDGELCCYDVTEQDTGDIPCAGGVGGVGGFGSGAVTSAVSTGSGGCQTCGPFATSAFMGAVPIGLCSGSDQIFSNMLNCICAGPCQAACSADLVCMGQSSSTPCFDCATDSSVGCGAQFSACANDI